VDDFVGVKVLCPYPTDARQIIRWMRAHAGFRVGPDRDEDARHDKAFGYRGYHFTLDLRGPLLEGNGDLAVLRCEVQIKTMLEEAWDAKTHGLSYKREEDIDPDLLLRMKQLSDALHLLDRQSEAVKLEMQRQERQQRARANGFGA
jgi:ppGpp synthetase/RelA/SpoT-type nucleotidyltranferase